MTTLVLPTFCAPRLDWPRVTALSGTLSLHLLILLLILVSPIAMMLTRQPPAAPMIVRDVTLPVPPPAIPVEPQPPRRTIASTPKPHSIVLNPLPTIVDEPSPVALPANPAVPTVAGPDIEPVETAPTALAYATRAGVPYPREALRRHEQGTVVLRVLVGIDGKPQTVEVESSSGSPRLDAAARDAIKLWTFRAGTRGGVAYAAWARVPIAFDLRSL